MKTIISISLLFFSGFLNASVMLYSNGLSILGLEKTDSQELNATMYGGSYEGGASSPADCVLKYRLVKNGENFKGELLPFSTELMNYSTSSGGDITFELDKNTVTIVSESAPDVCPLESNFSGDYHYLNKDHSDYKSAFDSLMKFNYTNSLNVNRKFGANKASQYLKPYMDEAIADGYYYASIYNDYGYFLQQANLNAEAVEILKIVISRSPGRTVAYLNIADTYWDLKKFDEAVKNYKLYLSMMSGKKDKIPERVFKRVN